VTDVTREQAQEIAESAVKNAFRDLGIHIEDVFEMRKDFAFLHEWRLTCEQVRGRGVVSLVTLSITGLVALLVLGVKGWVRFN
jgi:hypothetical protein